MIDLRFSRERKQLIAGLSQYPVGTSVARLLIGIVAWKENTWTTEVDT